jgi:hypothetical protein
MGMSKTPQTDALQHSAEGRIHSQPATDKYREGWERAFGKNKKEKKNEK